MKGSVKTNFIEEESPTGAVLEIVFAVIPVFNRLDFTRNCIQHLKFQSYRPVRIVVADGGSTDGTVEAIRIEHPDVVVLTSETELWWSGSMAMGVQYALTQSQCDSDFVLMMNNDTEISVEYVEKLVRASQQFDAAVGALVVDSGDATKILDAGEYIDWASYSFPVKTHIDEAEVFCDDVDVLPGRGSLVPLKMIRKAGNVDAKMLPHYLADYEFFCRLKQHGYRLGISYETSILAHIEETGIVPTHGKSGFRAIWREVFSRRSMSNVIDHWRFVRRHAPAQYRDVIQRRLLRRVIAEFTLRTPLRPLFLPVYWLICLPRRMFAAIQGQRRSFAVFAKAIRTHGINVLCNPQSFPGLIRWPLYFVASPGPIRLADLEQHGLKLEQLIAQGVLRSLRVNGWFALETLEFSNTHEPLKLKSLFWSAWNPFGKWTNTLAWRRDVLKKADA